MNIDKVDLFSDKQDAHSIAASGTVSDMETLLHQTADPSELINSRNKDNYTVLHYAYIRAINSFGKSHDECDIDMLQYLMSPQFNANPNIPVNGRPIIFDPRVYESGKGYQILQCLLTAESSITLSMIFEIQGIVSTTLSLAIEFNLPHYLQLFLEYISKQQISITESGITTPNSKNQTPIHQAIVENHFMLASLLHKQHRFNLNDSAATTTLVTKATCKKSARDFLFTIFQEIPFEHYDDNIFSLLFAEEDMTFIDIKNIYLSEFQTEFYINLGRKGNWTDKQLHFVLNLLLALSKESYKYVRALVICNPSLFEHLVVAFFKHVMCPADVETFKKVVDHSSWLWLKMKEILELNIKSLYIMTAPISCSCTKITLFDTSDNAGRRLDHCCHKFGKNSITKLNDSDEKCNEQLQDQLMSPLKAGSGSEYIYAIKNKNAIENVDTLSPIQTILFWSVFSGRWNIAKILLVQKDLNCIPLCLSLIRVLDQFEDAECECRHNVIMSELRQMCIDKVVNISDEYEKFECTVTELKAASIFLNLPLVGYCRKSCVDLAAEADSKILETHLFRNAVRYKFKGPFLYLSKLEMIPFILGGICLWPYVKRCQTTIKSKCPQVLSPSYDTTLDCFTSTGNDSPDLGKPRIVFSNFLQNYVNNTEKYSNKWNNDFYGTLLDNFVEFNHDVDKDEIWKSPDFYRTPLMKITFQIVMHIVLFVITGIVVGINSESTSMSAFEIVMYIILAGYLLEEVLEFWWHFKSRTLLSGFFGNKWNWLDILFLLAFWVSFFLRLVEIFYVEKHYLFSNDSEIKWQIFLHSGMHLARGLGLLMFGMRFLFTCLLFEGLGIKLYVSYLMFKNDLLPTIFIIFVTGLSFGILMESIVNEDEKGRYFLLGLFKIVFYAVFGDYGLDSLEAEVHANSTHKNRFSGQYMKAAVLLVILPAYIIITQLLLLNLIIALFNKTLEKYTLASRGLWLQNRYQMVLEAAQHSFSAPPFNIGEFFLRVFCTWVWRICCCEKLKRPSVSLDMSMFRRFKLFLALSIIKESQLRNNTHDT